MERERRGRPSLPPPASEVPAGGDPAERERRGGPVHASPVANVRPGGDPVVALTNNDVLCGRGGAVNGHPGNVRLRSLVGSMKAAYLSPKIRKLQKTQIAAAIVRTIRELDPPGRFLKEDRASGRWLEIGDQAATRKTSQALRENSSEFRACWREILAGGDGGAIDQRQGSLPEGP